MDKHLINEYLPDYAVMPGEVLVAELEMRGMTQQELAKRTGLTPKHIVAIAKAKSPITPETAIKFERALGMPAEYWLNLESHYQEAMARLAEEKRLEHDLGWLKRIPVSAMVKFGWVQKHKEAKSQLISVLRFFGIASADQWDDMWPNLNVAYRQHSHHEVYPEAVSAWLRRGEIEASNIHTEPYDRARFRHALDEIRGLTTQSPSLFIPKMKKLCGEAGVAVVFVPALPKTGVSGATRWLTPQKALIQLSLRYKTDDHLWFTFFHEAGHILLHGKKNLFIEGNNGFDEIKEAEANAFAESELIPAKVFAIFMSKNIYNKSSIQKFAREIGIAPGIVVGQLQYKGLLAQSYCNDLKQTFNWTE
jgi:HTH-type transcriptional regulator/antitoxin HigA